MKNLVFLIGLIAIFYGCKDLGEGAGFLPPSKLYPAKLNNSWEYEVFDKIEYYNNSGQIDNTEVFNWPNRIVTVTKTGDSVGTYSNLMLFEDYSIHKPQTRHYTWYSNSDSGFYSIAYAGSPGESSGVFIFPKINPNKKYVTVDEFRRIASLKNGILPTLPMVFEDSIGYWNPPRKVLAYPLKNGQRWIELVYPFYRERYINKSQIVNTQAGSFNCFVIEVDWDMSPKGIFNDYVNFEHGLIYREIIYDSVAIYDPNNPDPSSFCKMTSKAILVNKNF